MSVLNEKIVGEIETKPRRKTRKCRVGRRYEDFMKTTLSCHQ